MLGSWPEYVHATGVHACLSNVGCSRARARRHLKSGTQRFYLCLEPLEWVGSVVSWRERRATLVSCFALFFLHLRDVERGIFGVWLAKVERSGGRK